MGSHLPDLALDLIFCRLDVRSVAKAACVNRSFWQASLRCPLALGITRRTQDSLYKWLSCRNRSAQVVAVSSSWGVTRAPTAAFEKLRFLRWTCCKVPIRALDVAPRQLRVLTVHRLMSHRLPGLGAFSTGAVLGLFPRLDVARITFVTDTWHRVRVDGGPTSLRILELRQCPDVFVVDVPVSVKNLSLISTEGVYCYNDAYPAQGALDVLQISSPDSIRLHPNMVPPRVRVLVIQAPCADLSPAVWSAICRVRGLATLNVELDLAVFESPPPSTLQRITLALSRLAITEPWPACVAVDALVNGRRIEREFFCSP